MLRTHPNPAQGPGVWVVRPSGPLSGTVALSGAKNAATKLLVACLLPVGTSTVTRVPECADTELTASMLRHLGVGVDRVGDTVTVHAPARPATVDLLGVPAAGTNRIAVLLAGPLLARTGEVRVPVPGGDRIGVRPLDLHAQVLAGFGASVDIGPAAFAAEAPTGGLGECRTRLAFPSVGATEQFLLTAAATVGTHRLEGGATEPEIDALAGFLARMGPRVGRRGRTWTVTATGPLHVAETTAPPDRLEAFTYLAAGVATGGRVTVVGITPHTLTPAIAVLRQMGATVLTGTDTIVATSNLPLTPTRVSTGPHPGVATDWGSAIALLMGAADGRSVLHETVFESRMEHLITHHRAMGRDVALSTVCGLGCRFSGTAPHVAAIVGRRPTGGRVAVEDVRTSMSAVIDATRAAAPSVIGGITSLLRGHHRPLQTLRRLGADITPSNDE